MKQFNNKILFIILLVLAGAFALTRLFRSPARESNLNADVLKVDTSRIDKLHLYPIAEQHREVRLTKGADGWKVSDGKVTSLANSDHVRSLLVKLATLEPERIVTRNTDKWNEYEVGDSTGTTLIAFSGEEELANLSVGKTGMGVTYMRPQEEDEVYAVSGTLTSSFNRKFNDWRDQTLLKLNEAVITRVTFDYPADSGFVLSRKSEAWMVDNNPADSAATAAWLGRLRLKKLTTFADDFSADSDPDVTMTIDASTPFVVRGWKVPSGWILSSDRQPNVYFADEGGKVAREIFVGQDEVRSTR